MPAATADEADHSELAWKPEHVNERDIVRAPLLTKDVDSPHQVSGKKLAWITAIPAMVAVFALHKAVTALRQPCVVTASKMTTNTFVPSKYEVVTGIFIQSDESYTGRGFDMFNESFGLIDRSPDRWSNLTFYINDLNARADPLTAYKLFYVARHGEGHHNVGEAKYGTEEWDCHWSMLNGDDEITWGPDPYLTSRGEGQALAANAAWKRQLVDNVPLPQTMYCSPLRRSADTLQITWSDILLDKGVRPMFKENWRESIGLHTCDKRSTRTIIESEHPRFIFEDPFSEDDLLWTAGYQETNSQQAQRTQRLLNELFATDPSAFVSITAHSGTISAFWTVVGHHNFDVGTGGFVPMLIKATGHKEQHLPVITGGQSATAPACSPTS